MQGDKGLVLVISLQ